ADRGPLEARTCGTAGHQRELGRSLFARGVLQEEQEAGACELGRTGEPTGSLRAVGVRQARDLAAVVHQEQAARVVEGIVVASLVQLDATQYARCFVAAAEREFELLRGEAAEREPGAGLGLARRAWRDEDRA